MPKKPGYYYHQSAVVPCRHIGGALEVLLITSRKRKRWVVPKGIIEPDMNPADSAAKEALEEAGIEGVVLPESIGAYHYEKWGGICSVQVFAMAVTKVLDDWQENFRDREWVSVEEAVKRIRETKLKKILRDLPGFLKAHASVAPKG